MITIIRAIAEALCGFPALEKLIRIISSYMSKIRKQARLKEYAEADKKAEVTKDTTDLERMFDSDNK